jgi:hypothetical protein
MDRSLLQRKSALLAVLGLVLASTAGCQVLMLTAGLLFKGTDVDPEFAGLKDKKVAVICRPTQSVQYANPYASRELANEVSALLKTNVPKIDILDQQKINKWIDEHDADAEYTDVGKGVKADLVVAIELEAFNLKAGQTLFQGRSNVAVHVFDCQKGGHNKEIFHKSMPEIVYPRGMPVATDRREADFRHEYVLVLAKRVGELFYQHDPYADVGEDANAWR